MTQTHHPSRAMEVANWFLDRSWDDSSKPPCDQLKLYKLTFYSHGWYLGNKSEELFPEDVEAWPHGPVVRDLYLEFKEFGRNPIDRHGRMLVINDDDETSFVYPKHNGELNSFFELIWDVYGDKTGIQLSNMTHRKGEPWTIIAEKYGYDLTDKPTIPTEIIKAAFDRKIDALAR